jgi:cytochrome c oxidase assembly protein subunit 15
LHLDGALALYSLLLWTALGLRGGPRIAVSPALLGHGWIALAGLVATITWGALVAGLGAGGIANTWPLMDGEFLPRAATDWPNPFENAPLAQFVHRWLGPATMVVVLAWVWRCRRIGGPGLAALGGMVVLQVGLGLATLLSQAEIAIAVAHQAGAILLLTLLLSALRPLSARPPDGG